MEYGNAFVYVDSQGYLLEIADNKLELPVIKGYHTPSEKIEAGARLEQQDLEDWDAILKITEAANNQEIGSLITQIDITDKNDYKVYFDTEQKIFHIEDITNINDRMLMVKLVIEKEKNNKGEIFIVNDKEYRFLPGE